MKISLNQDELSALYGLPHAVICLYVMAIRPRMNYATGLVGIKPYISWHALTEWVYVAVTPGPRAPQLSIEAVRRAARRLQGAGLLRIASNVCNRQLIFECVLADRDQSVRNKPDRHSTGQLDRSRTKPGKGFTARLDISKTGKPDKHPGSGLLISPPVVTGSFSNDEPLRGPSSKPENAKAVRQGNSARSRPLTDEEIARLPAAIKKRLQQSRAGKRA